MLFRSLMAMNLFGLPVRGKSSWFMNRERAGFPRKNKEKAGAPPPRRSLSALSGRRTPAADGRWRLRAGSLRISLVTLGSAVLRKTCACLHTINAISCPAHTSSPPRTLHSTGTLRETFLAFTSVSLRINTSGIIFDPIPGQEGKKKIQRCPKCQVQRLRVRERDSTFSLVILWSRSDKMLISFPVQLLKVRIDF